MFRYFRVLIASVVSIAFAVGCTPSSEQSSPAEDAQAQTPTQDAPAAPQKVSGARLIILGFDGVDPRRVDRLVKDGKLPNIQKLGDGGYRGALGTTNPPQSPVAWSAFATGLPAGQHGIFDFIERDPSTYFPRVATNKYTHAEVQGGEVVAASAENLRLGPSFWDVIARGGVPVRTLSVPYAYPPPKDGARSLAGLGTPDIRGINSSFTLLTPDKAKAEGKPPAGGQVALLSSTGDSAWTAKIAGPRIKVDGKRVATETEVRVSAASDGGLEIEAGGAKQSVGVGKTGDYVTVTFTPAPALTISAATRFTVRSGAPKPEIYVEPMSIIPTEPYFPVAAPASLGEQLWKGHGPFKTVGWIHDTSALGEGAMDEDQYLAEAMATMQRRAELTLEALNEGTDRVLVSVFTAPDRIGHMFYRYFVPKHPALGKGEKRAKYANALDDSYVAMDGIIGKVMAALGPEDVLMIMSDHGFDSFERGFHLNSWLLKEKYLALKPGTKPPVQFFQGVDWTRTRAYAMGTGSIFINVKGREKGGIVEPAKVTALAKDIIKKLGKVKDKRTKVVLGAYLGDEQYAGPERANAPEIRVALAPGYRASWATTLGGLEKGLFENNTKKWSGDHASARPEDVPGILISNRPLAVEDPRIEDLAATAYAFSGVAAPDGVIGRPLLAKKE